MKALGRLLEKIAGMGAIIALVIAPTQWSFTLAKGIKLCLADLLLIPLAGVWLLGILLTWRWLDVARRPDRWDIVKRQPFWCFWPHFLFFTASLVSVFVAADRGDAVKETIQILLYFVVAPVLFLAFIEDPEANRKRRIAILLAALLAPLLLHIAVAALQYSRSGTDDLSVRGLFSNRNVLGGWFTLTVPILSGLAFASKRWWALLLAGLTLLAVLSLTLSGAAYTVLAMACLLLALRRGARFFLVTALILTLWQVCVLPRLPRENDLAHFRSVALYDENGVPDRRYPEWQAAASLILTHPLTGVGAGNYQREIGPYYDVVPNATGPAEPDIQNLYLVIAATLGLPGVLLLLAILAHAMITALSASSTTSAWQKDTSWGLAIALGAFAVTAIWHPLLVRGIGIPLAAVLTLALRLNTNCTAPQNTKRIS